jgi:hypothetical protein
MEAQDARTVRPRQKNRSKDRRLRQLLQDIGVEAVEGGRPLRISRHHWTRPLHRVPERRCGRLLITAQTSLHYAAATLAMEMLCLYAAKHKVDQ